MTFPGSPKVMRVTWTSFTAKVERVISQSVITQGTVTIDYPEITKLMLTMIPYSFARSMKEVPMELVSDMQSRNKIMLHLSRRTVTKAQEARIKSYSN